MNEQFANTARQIHLALIQSPTLEGIESPGFLAETAICHAVAIEAAIARHESEVSEVVETKPGHGYYTIKKIDLSDPDTYPDSDQDCHYAIYDPRCEFDDEVPAWVIGKDAWSKDLLGFYVLCVNAFVFRSVYWCPADSMSSRQFRELMDEINP